MAPETRIKIAKPDIVSLFENSNSKIYKKSDLRIILDENRKFWRLRQNMSLQGFIDFLIDETIIKEVIFDFPNRPERRYIWGSVPVYEIVLSLKDRAYFSHFTAMTYHDLTDQIPKTLYVNKEQFPPSYRDNKLSQNAINLAFSRKPRISKAIAQYAGYNICLVESMGEGELGIVETQAFGSQNIRVTNIERTLIDIAVRPFYSGGVFEVLSAYKRAASNVSVNKMSSILSKMKYIYPYHQVIGFYLERSGGYSSSKIDLLSKYKIDLDFYLTYNLKDKEYSKKWRLFYPKGL